MFTFLVGAGMGDDGDHPARVFRENDSLGHDSNLLLRPMRRLVIARKPPGLVTPLAFSIDGKPVGYFGALFTGRDRICFWPAYPTSTDMTKHVDHITLEIGSGTTHATRYDADGKPHRTTPDGYAWRLHQFPRSPIALWFQMLMRWDTIHLQDKLLQRSVDGKSPSGGEHVKATFLNYAAGIQQPVVVPVYPSPDNSPNYALCMLYFAADHPHEGLKFEADMFTADGLEKWIKGWDDEIKVPVQAVAFSRGGRSFVAASACPPGEISETAMFGFPHNKSM
jgi:hypothetical protein